ncbi:26S proteasome non-ATPase regulatory subunit 8 [Drosophila grimshawi]|uniref:26S proteasome non-ATPase regulatory subunit 8 n=1 Tax=Drosophila grimshawi TaxID=7222 RepID=B4J2Y6_DROGR|nr:26S proteasome non-ATPase regulatory subunit 8 [Drosophila grimshawi]EDV97156.1 GH16677 [Drosophila grimshawi]
MLKFCKELKSEWTKNSPNLGRCGQLLDSLKLEMVRVGFVGLNGQGPMQPNQKLELQTARDILEIAIEHSIKVKDNASYERYMTQLKMYYYDYDKFLESSSQMHKFMGLHLLYMLATNRIADFHIELERLPSALLLQNRYISPVLALENYFMEGRYNKILQAKKSMPSELYADFMDMLVGTVREEIASCLEKSYEKMSQKQAALRLGLKPGGTEMNALAAKRTWTLDADGSFNYAVLHSKQREKVPAKDIAGQTLTYAHELEKIV